MQNIIWTSYSGGLPSLALKYDGLELGALGVVLGANTNCRKHGCDRLWHGANRVGILGILVRMSLLLTCSSASALILSI
jgi:hypothetical protein